MIIPQIFKNERKIKMTNAELNKTYRNEIFREFSDLELSRIILLDKNIEDNCLSYCVYFILDLERNLIKIGKTRNLLHRYMELEHSYKFCGIKNKLRVEYVFWTLSLDESTKLEKIFHLYFANFSNYLEWFNYDEDAYRIKLSTMTDIGIQVLYQSRNQYVIVTNDTWNKPVFKAIAENGNHFDSKNLNRTYRRTLHAIMCSFDFMLYREFFIRHPQDNPITSIHYWYLRSAIYPDSLFNYFFNGDNGTNWVLNQLQS